MVAPAIDLSLPWQVVRGEALSTLMDLPDACVDGIVTDPPYSSGGAFRGDRTVSTTLKYQQTGQAKEWSEFTGDNRDQRGYLAWCALWMWECLRVSKPGAPIVCFTDWRQLPITTDAIQAGGFVWRGVASWDKTEGVRPAMGRFRSQCEYLVWGSNGPMPLRNDVGVLPGAWTIGHDREDKHHIAGKPAALMQEVCRIVPPGGIVLDPFAGSGTTGVGAIRAGRRFLGIEVEAGHAETAKRRLEDAVGVKPMRGETPFLALRGSSYCATHATEHAAGEWGEDCRDADFPPVSVTERNA